jgi:hypothetical protein
VRDKAGAGERYEAGAGERYAAVMTVGVNYQLARVAAGLCEAAYMYEAMRWVVFRDARTSVGSRS